ncbi:hypothetical protein CBS101457_005209 [Exobasidium rhododendri]|nr:hypothetical protein CBS101457_005209 [Exobasidium rhododendri]
MRDERARYKEGKWAEMGCVTSSGGNQRELARAKAAKKTGAAGKGKPTDGLSLEQRRQRDADAIKAKETARAKKEAEAKAAG